MRTKGSWLIYPLFFIALMWALHTLTKNFMTDPEFSKFLLNKTIGEDFNRDVWTVLIRVHIILAVTAILAGPLGFVKKIRVKRPGLHRLIGKVYIGSILLNILPALYVALHATGGIVATAGFFVLSAVWLYTTLKAYTTIRKRQVAAHRRWMIRSYAITLANNSLYVINLVLEKGFGFEYVTAYVIAVWSCWMVNLFLAESYLKFRKNGQAA
ncbi:putative membrane protein [Tumebacillus sp. BK434]|uniref:DUF2306 domain-containing protein n=1 Tax=Tumebacillus sp. BK434 TaxID=2512169 RepID=UPI00104B117F|nr:DUF2306 domain-containing protein [Tumebacillus sp. BK434]TCP55389.1 putative membrane protein [Tumebacillus sp. BK434]